MITHTKYISLFLCLLNSHNIHTDAAIVCCKVRTRSRTGDQLSTYVKTKWIEHLLGIPAAIEPFPCATKFEFNETETLFTSHIFPRYERKRVFLRRNYISWINDAVRDKQHKTAFLIIKASLTAPLIERMRNDQVFMNKIRSCFQLKEPIPADLLPHKDNPEDIIVGVHIRRGSGPDKDPNRHKRVQRLGGGAYIIPHRISGRWLPDSYYIEQIEALHKKYPGKTVHVYLFTDMQKPEELLNHYRTAFKHASDIKIKNIGLCNQSEDAIIYDLIAMQQCDCLIRPDSNYSKMADLLGKHTITIAPDIDTAIINGQKKCVLRAKMYQWDPAIVTHHSYLSHVTEPVSQTGP